jgi:hypothetical protein
MRRARRVSWSGTLVAAVSGVLLATAAPAQAATVVAQWSMDGSGSSMSDATGRGHTGTLHNVAVRQPGLSGTGYGFTSTPSYVTVPSSGDFSPGTGNFKFSVNVRFGAVPTTAVGDFDLLRRGLASTPGGSYKMEILRSGRAFCDYRGSSGELSVTNGPNLADNRWHKITCARSGNSVVLTVDATSWSRSGSLGSITNSERLYIGARDTSGGDQYRGLMDSVSVSKG